MYDPESSANNLSIVAMMARFAIFVIFRMYQSIRHIPRCFCFPYVFSRPFNPLYCSTGIYTTISMSVTTRDTRQIHKAPRFISQDIQNYNFLYRTYFQYAFPDYFACSCNLRLRYSRGDSFDSCKRIQWRGYLQRLSEPREDSMLSRRRWYVIISLHDFSNRPSLR